MDSGNERRGEGCSALGTFAAVALSGLLSVVFSCLFFRYLLINKYTCISRKETLAINKYIYLLKEHPVLVVFFSALVLFAIDF